MKKLLIMLMIAATGKSMSQAFWSQPWTVPLPAWQSTVTSCANPVPQNNIVCDNFTVALGQPLTGIRWWGVVSNVAQLGRQYHIHIYVDNGACQPNFNTQVYRGCLVPTTALVGVDCNGNNVYQFNVVFHGPAWQVLPPGNYWIQISENDANSVKIGAPDFWWSSHQGIVGCQALQKNALGAIVQPLIDPCNFLPDDLAFELF